MSVSQAGRIPILVLLAMTTNTVRSLAWGIDYQDTYVSIRYLPSDKQPGYSKTIPEVAGNISYANGWTYGSKFVSIDYLDYGKGDYSNSVTGHANSNSGQVYSGFHSTLSGNKITGSDLFRFGPIRDIGIDFGLELSLHNDQFASYQKIVMVGPQFSINLPRGFWNITVGMAHEWDTNAFLSNGNGTNFNTTYIMETAWAYPFAVGPVPLNFTGFGVVYGPKGAGASGDFYHHVEIIAHPKLLVDIGELLGYTPKKIEAGVGFEYWHNKYGAVSHLVPGSEERSAFFEVGYHF